MENPKGNGVWIVSILRFKTANCKNCYKCVRGCPIKAIEVKDNQAQVIESDCVLCGSCVLTCPQNAKQVRNDVARAKELLASGVPVYASVAPSFVAGFDLSGIDEMRAHLRSLGFAGAEETAKGAYIVKTEYERLVAQSKQSVIISSCCHTVVKLIQKYHPAVVGNIAPVLSPMQAHARLIKEEHPGAAVVFIGPCISKKDEAQCYPGIVDCVLTFDELSEWFAAAGEDVPTLDTRSGAALDESRYLSRFFPVSGGILATMKKDSAYRYLTVDGMENCMEAIAEIEDGKLTNCFVEMSACPGSCVNGPVIRKHQHSILSSKTRVEDYAASPDAADYDIDYRIDTAKAIRDEYVALQLPGEAKIQEILHKMGKHSPADELNCGTCGYATCRDKAVAVYFGKADISMCLPYMKEKAESFSDNIIKATPNAILTVGRDFNIIQINDAGCDMFSINDPKDVAGRPVSMILDAGEFEDLFDGSRRLHVSKTYLAEYSITAEQTLVLDESGDIAICILRDITAEETENQKLSAIKNEAAEITDKVIEKQMRIVQEIASLLGETTAETKIALTKLKNTIQMEDER